MAMTIEQLKEIKNNVVISLNSGNVIDALDLLHQVATDEGNFNAVNDINNIRQTYDFMIHYLIEGTNDPERERVYNDTIETIRQIAEDLLYAKLIDQSTDLKYSTARTCKHRNLSLPHLLTKLSDTEHCIELAKSVGNPTDLLNRDKDNILKDIFNYIWAIRSDVSFCKYINEFISSPSSSEATNVYIIAAITLSLLGNYDKSKLETLFDVYDNSMSDSVSAAALTGILFTLRRHAAEIKNNRYIISRLQSWEDSVLTYSRLCDVLKAIIRTRDTDRVSAKMRDEVIPELMKLNPDILNKIKGQGTDTDITTFENNPEWEELLENSGIADKMKELTEMQSEGADLLMITFANLKGFPFFSSPSAWFLPFDIDNPAINIVDEFKSKLNAILSIGKGMCDSDKYSLVLALSSMPESQRQLMLNQFDMQLSQLSEDLKAKLERTARPEFNESTTLFVRQLYRFFKLFRKNNEFEDPFALPFSFIDLPILGDMLSDDEMLKVTAEFYFKRGYYSEALSLFMNFNDSEKGVSDYWEKVGFSLQNLKKYNDALQAYHKAELLKEPSIWLLKKLAFLSRKTGDFRSAVTYYEKLLESTPDNTQFIMFLGYSKQESGDIQGALHAYYHANYVDPSNHDIWRAIGWAELLNLNLEKSQQYYSRLFGDTSVEFTLVDFLNAGHSYLLAGDYKSAVELYKKSSAGRFGEFEKAFNDDKQTLINLGIKPLTLNLVLDKIRLENRAI